MTLPDALPSNCILLKTNNDIGLAFLRINQPLHAQKCFEETVDLEEHYIPDSDELAQTYCHLIDCGYWGKDGENSGDEFIAWSNVEGLIWSNMVWERWYRIIDWPINELNQTSKETLPEQYETLLEQ